MNYQIGFYALLWIMIGVFVGYKTRTLGNRMCILWIALAPAALIAAMYEQIIDIEWNYVKRAREDAENE